MDLPDIAQSSTTKHPSVLEKVGMEGVAIPIQTSCGQIPATHDLLVSVDIPNMRGIHMSRLLLASQEMLEVDPFSFHLQKKICQRMLESHNESTQCATIRSRWIHLKKVSSLKSEKSGWRQYNVQYETVLKNGKSTCTQTVEILYSSTCPCSAALSSAAIVEKAETDLVGETLTKRTVIDWLETNATIATPHSQRSSAKVSTIYESAENALLLDVLIDRCEKALQTPVQAVVKRVDEQEFARRSGQNPMFAEDAARALMATLNTIEHIADYHIKIEHFEGLHAHNAVVECRKQYAV